MTIEQATSGVRTDLPYQVRLADGTIVELRPMKRWDRHAVIIFIRGLSAQARLVMPIDVSDDAAADAWIADLESGRARSILARAGDQLVGFAGLRRGAAPWTQHLGEFSLLVQSGATALELCQHLCRELLGIALDLGLDLGLRKVVTQVRSDDEEALALFSDAGFHPEAVLVDQAMDESGRTYDLLIMSRALAEVSQLSRVFAPVIDDAGEIAEPAMPEEQDLPLPAPVPVPFVVKQDLPPSQPARVPAFIAKQDLPPPEPVRVPALTVGVMDVEPAVTVPELADPVERPAPAPPARTRRARRRYVVAAALVAVVSLALGAVYLAAPRGNSRQLRVLGAAATPNLSTSTTVPSWSAPLASTHAGSGAVFLAVARPTVGVRVSIDPGSGGRWFWCVESSFGLPLSDHYCATAGDPEAGTHALVAETVLRVDPRWPSGALYFIQMYCEGACVWHVDTTPLP